MLNFSFKNGSSRLLGKERMIGKMIALQLLVVKNQSLTLISCFNFKGVWHYLAGRLQIAVN